MIKRNPKEQAEHFRTLHTPGRPLVLFNIWDAGSARAVAASGAPALATGSWSVANANGFGDGEQMPFSLAIDNLRRIVQAVDVPVTFDLESGYGKTPAAVGLSIDQSIQAGAVGCNLEDSFPENGTLREVSEQVQRITAARNAANARNPAYFINARTDVFFQSPLPERDQNVALTSVLERAHAYAAAGADGLFVPGLANENDIARLAAASPLPLNIMVGENTPSLRRLAELGVARVSHGPGPYLAVMNTLQQAARHATQLV